MQVQHEFPTPSQVKLRKKGWKKGESWRGGIFKKCDRVVDIFVISSGERVKGK